MEQERQTNAIEKSDKTCKIELSITKSQKAEQITRNDGGRPYLRMLSTKIRTAQKCIQELNTCTKNSYNPLGNRSLWKNF